MKLIKKLARLAGLLILIALASLGIGLTGAAPVSLDRWFREERKDTRIELMEEREEPTGKKVE